MVGSTSTHGESRGTQPPPPPPLSSVIDANDKRWRRQPCNAAGLIKLVKRGEGNEWAELPERLLGTCRLSLGSGTTHSPAARVATTPSPPFWYGNGLMVLGGGTSLRRGRVHGVPSPYPPCLNFSNNPQCDAQSASFTWH